MIHHLIQDLTEVEAGIIGHGCNCDSRGIMNSGVAKAVRNKWSCVYKQHKKYIKPGIKRLGTIDVIMLSDELSVANMYTQGSYGYDNNKYADTEAIYTSLYSLVKHATLFDHDVYIPKLGCGLGGLNYNNDVFPIIELISNEFSKITINVYDI